MLLIPLTATDTSDILTQAGSVVSDLMPLLIIVLGIGIGLWVLQAIFHLKG